ncbi:MAG: nitroreductase family protein [Selenomonadaceae bacterium]|nr:nitroreductase family protein [Selenomonadaceae bacterium]
MNSFQEAVTQRRSIYKLGRNIPVLQTEIMATIERMTKEIPSPFNMQSSRVVVTMLDHHENVWEITKDALKKIVPAEKFAATEEKIDGFAAGYGTILFYEESDTIYEMQKKFPIYADNFPIWAAQSNGMLQFAIWTALEDMGLGVNIQHYNMLIDEDVKKIFDIPGSWDLVAQMVFGEVLEQPAPIEKLSTGERVKIFRRV